MDYSRLKKLLACQKNEMTSSERKKNYLLGKSVDYNPFSLCAPELAFAGIYGFTAAQLEEDIEVRYGTNIQILLQEKDASREILSRMARELQIDYMVCGGKMEQYRDKNLGEIVIHISEQDAGRVKKFLNDHDVIWHEYQQEE